MKNNILFLLLLSITVLVAACSSGQIENRTNWEVKDFTFINQENKQFGYNDLKGKVWIADFIFTKCSTVCPTLTLHMANLQKKMKEEGLDVTFVSFSVDPEFDSPKNLKTYAEKFEADFSNWHFLTGYKQEEISSLANDSFKTIVQNDPKSDQVYHSTNFYLIDQEGNVAKAYKASKDVPYEEIIHDVKVLLN